MMRCLLVLAVLTSLCCPLRAAFPTASRRNNPLLGDEGRKRLRATECHFGKTLKELGSTWFADLGPPFGVMYCIKCECVPVQKKRRIVARVQCRNIKNECPQPKCEEPVLLPGRCCKMCPGENYVPELVLDAPVIEEDKNMKHFGALLTPRSSLVFKRDDIVNIPSTSDKPAYQIVATGRFTFHKKNLYFSFYLANTLNQPAPRPRTIQFINYKGDLLEEQMITSSGYQNATGKVCGVWRRVPRDYKRLLRDEALYIALLWGNDLALSGRIARFKALYSEHFSALLTPPSSHLVPPEGGGTAIVSVSSLAATNSIHMTLVFNGVFAPSETTDVPLLVRLEGSEKTVHEETIRITKPSTELNLAEVRFTVSSPDFRLLSRGKAMLTISSKTHPDFMYVRGPILTRVTCEIFQAPLAPFSEEDHPAANPGGMGLAWMYLTREGGLAYNWEVEGVGSDPAVSLAPKKGPKNLHFLNVSNNNPSSGVLDRLPPRSVESLYNGDLSIHVAGADNRVLRGGLVARPVAGAIDSARPVLLKSKVSTDLVGLAWMAIDYECDLHYEVQLSGDHENNMFQLYLEDTPLVAPNAPFSRRILEDFNGTQLEGFTQLTTEELSRIDSGVCFLEVLDLRTGKLLLRANMKMIKIPSECLASTSDNDVPSILSIDPPHLLPEITKCLHEGAFYDEGTQWRHARDPCRMCHCMRGKERCDQMPCPPLTCNSPVRINQEQCCPSCSNTSVDANRSAGCHMAGQFHPAGSTWHPYLPPHGFNLCTVVTCDTATLSIRYSRVSCPALRCPEKEQIRPTRTACCKVCPKRDEEYARDQSVQVVSKTKSSAAILAEGGCMHFGRGPFENNTEWTHSIPSVGPIPCVRCSCKEGKVSCERKRCPRTQCYNTAAQLLEPGMDECCNSQCRRYRRQSRHRKGAKAPANP